MTPESQSRQHASAPCPLCGRTADVKPRAPCAACCREIGLGFQSEPARWAWLQRRLIVGLALVAVAIALFLLLPRVLVAVGPLTRQWSQWFTPLGYIPRVIAKLFVFGSIALLLWLDGLVAQLPQRTALPPTRRAGRLLTVLPGATIALCAFWIPGQFRFLGYGLTFDAIALVLAAASIASAAQLAAQTCRYDRIHLAAVRQGGGAGRSWFRRPWMTPWSVILGWIGLTAWATNWLVSIEYRPRGTPVDAPFTATEWLRVVALPALPLAILVWVACVRSATHSLARWRRA